MHVKLNISDDAELRSYVKDLIRGQVESILRETTQEQLINILTVKFKGVEDVFAQVMREEIAKAFRSMGRYSTVEAVLQDLVRAEVKRIVIDKLKGAQVTL